MFLLMAPPPVASRRIRGARSHHSVRLLAPALGFAVGACTLQEPNGTWLLGPWSWTSKIAHFMSDSTSWPLVPYTPNAKCVMAGRCCSWHRARGLPSSANAAGVPAELGKFGVAPTGSPKPADTWANVGEFWRAQMSAVGGGPAGVGHACGARNLPHNGRASFVSVLLGLDLFRTDVARADVRHTPKCTVHLRHRPEFKLRLRHACAGACVMFASLVRALAGTLAGSSGDGQGCGGWAE